MPRKGIPESLANKESDLGQLVYTVGNTALGSAVRLAGAELVQKLVRKECQHYKHSLVDDVLCQSGESTGRPYRGRTCTECVVGQFSANMVFIGELMAQPSASSK